MTFINYATREINCKVVLAGPTGCGKADIARSVYDSVPSLEKGKLVSLDTGSEPTLFFNFISSLRPVRGFKLRYHLYTRPEPNFYNASARLILKGVDGIILILDCSSANRSANLACMEKLRKHLVSWEYSLEVVPLVLLAHRSRDDNASDAAYIKQRVKPFFS